MMDTEKRVAVKRGLCYSTARLFLALRNERYLGGAPSTPGDGVDRRRWRTCASWYRRLVVLITWCVTRIPTTPILPVSRSPLLSASRRTDLRLPENPPHVALRGRCRRASACICGMPRNTQRRNQLVRERRATGRTREGGARSENAVVCAGQAGVRERAAERRRGSHIRRFVSLLDIYWRFSTVCVWCARACAISRFVLPSIHSPLLPAYHRAIRRCVAEYGRTQRRFPGSSRFGCTPCYHLPGENSPHHVVRQDTPHKRE